MPARVYEYCKSNWSLTLPCKIKAGPYLLCESSGEERDEVFDVELEEPLQMRVHDVHFELLLSQLRHVLRIEGVTL